MSNGKLAIVFVGLPASGKSTKCNRLMNDYIRDGKLVFVYSTDDYIVNQANSKDSTYNDIFLDEIKNAKTHCDKRLIDAIRLNTDIILWDQTNLTERKRLKLKNQLELHGYEVHFFCFVIISKYDEILWMNRLASRTDKQVSDEVIQKMKSQFQIPGIDTNETNTTYFNIYGEQVKL